MKTTYRENGERTTRTNYKPVGWGIDSKIVYAKYETEYSVSDGIIRQKDFAGYATDSEDDYKGYIREYNRFYTGGGK